VTTEFQRKLDSIVQYKVSQEDVESVMMTAKEVKDFGSNIKNLPLEQRKAAGLKFKEMKSLLVAASTEALKVDKKRQGVMVT
jgi:hypothetical protein